MLAEQEKEAKKQAKLLAEQEKEAKKQAKLLAEKEKEAKKQEKKEEKEKKAKEVKPKKEKKEKKAKEAKEAKEEEKKEVVEEEARAKVQVVEFTFEGVTYWKSSENILYDPKTQDTMGIWCENTQSIKPAPEESDDELSEEEYEDEDE